MDNMMSNVHVSFEQHSPSLQSPVAAIENMLRIET